MVTQMKRDLEGLGVLFCFKSATQCSFAVMCARRAGRLVTGLVQAAAALVHADQQPGSAYVDSQGCWIGRVSLDFPVLSQVRRSC